MNILILGGGGSRGCFSAGFLYESFDKIKFDKIYGTSVGALNGTLLAQCYVENNRDLLRQFWTEKIEKTKHVFKKNYLKIVIGKNPFNFSPLWKMLKEAIDFPAIKEAKAEVVVTTVDLITGKIFYISSRDSCPEDFHASVRGSANFPIAFSPIQHKGALLVDGGIRDNVPISIIKKHAQDGDKVYLIYPHPTKIDPPESKYKNVISQGLRVIDIMTHEMMTNDMSLVEDIDNVLRAFLRYKNKPFWLDDKKIFDIIPILPSLPVTTSVLDFNKKELTEGFNKGVEKAKEIFNQ